MSGATLERISEPAEARPVEMGEAEQNEFEAPGTNVELDETRVTGLFHDRQAANDAIEELKSAGFNGDAIAIAMDDEAEQERFIQKVDARAVASEIIPSLPELPPRTVLVVVEADERAEEALKVLNRHHAVTGGVRVPID
jgi:hypothetical protein